MAKDQDIAALTRAIEHLTTATQRLERTLYALHQTGVETARKFLPTEQPARTNIIQNISPPKE